MPHKPSNKIFLRFNEGSEFFSLFVQQMFVNLGEMRRVSKTERSRVVENAPNFFDKSSAFH